MPKEVRLQRRIPESFFNARRELAERGQARLYTQSDLEAVVSYVSRRPSNHPLGTRLEPVDVDKLIGGSRAIAQRTQRERAQTLADRIEKPSLLSRISQAKASATYTLPEQKKLTLDFDKLSIFDQRGIFIPKVEATLKRLEIILELIKEDHSDAAKSVVLLNEKLRYFLEHSHEVLATRTPAQLKALDWGLKSISNVPFKQVRRNISTIVGRLAFIADGGYFDKLPL